MSHFIVNRFEKIQKSILVMYVILEFLRKLLVKVRPNLHDSHFDSSGSSLGKCSFILSYSIILSKQHTVEYFAGGESETFTITRLKYETALLTLIKETQLYLLPEIFLDLEQQNFTMTAPHFSGNIGFVGNCGILRALVPLNEECVDINWEFISKNISTSKILLPINRFSKDLAL